MAKATNSIQSNIAQRRREKRFSDDEDYLLRREQLLKAAGVVFQQKGFKGASINDIAKAVGIDRTSLYYYTSGKEELFRELVHEAVLSNILMAEIIQSSTEAPSQKIRNFITSLMASFEIHYPYLYMYVQEDMAQITQKSTGWAKEMNNLARRFNTAVIAIVQEGLDDGSFKPSDASAQLVAYGIIGMCNWSHRWFKPTGKFAAPAIGALYADLVLAGLEREPGQR